MDACGEGHFDIAELLLDAGADHSLAQDDGWTTLMAAARSKYVHIVEVLMRAGADLGARLPSNGTTALHEAICARSFEAAEAMVKAGADVNLPGRNDLPVLTFSLLDEEAPLSLVHAIVDAGADLEARYKECTALIYAVQERNVPAVDTLIKAGADLFVEGQAMTKTYYSSGEEDEDEEGDRRSTQRVRFATLLDYADGDLVERIQREMDVRVAALLSALPASLPVDVRRNIVRQLRGR